MKTKLTWMAGLVAMLSACGSSPGSSTDDAGGATGDSALPDAGDVAPDLGEVAPFGLDARPANPTCVASARPANAARVELRAAFSAHTFRRPVALLQAPGDAAWYVVEKPGRVIRIADENQPESSVFLDLTTVVHAGPSEMGLLGLAFDPDFATTGHVYASWNRREGSAEYSRISRFTVAPGQQAIDLDTELVILDFEQPFENHNGGDLAFGPDGYLYISFGDGGSAGDPLNYGQNRDVLFGKILRIDVLGASADEPYRIPSDNPFADGGGAPETFAWGLRNVWKFSFDRATGDLWAGDVGQGEWEEVNLIRNGGNYGWRVLEGTSCFDESGGCDTLDSEPPVVQYGHDEGRSITGGVVYRGTALPALQGRYLYGDFVSGRIWAVAYDAETGEPSAEVLVENSGLAIAAFGQDAEGEVYIVHYGSGNDGRIYRLQSLADLPESPFPESLSQTGCVDPNEPQRLAEGLIPYEVRVPFWSDGARKERWFAIPDGATISVNATGDLDLPPGSVVVKEFYRNERLFETRLMMRHDDGGWAGYSYAWLPDGSDAVWVRGGEVREVEGEPWLFPSGPQCLACHTDVAGRTLGLELAQLSGTMTYPNGRTADQVGTLQHIGILPTQIPAVRALPLLADESVPADDRAHAWLHTNCAFCHAPDAPARSNANFSWHSGSLDDLCDQEPLGGDLGVEGARTVVGGDLDRSLLWIRTQRQDAAAMPPLGSWRPDPEGSELLRAFVEGGRCPSP